MFKALTPIAALIAIASLASPARAAIVTLDLQLDSAAQTWQVFASVSDDTDGLASFALDVTGSGGATVTSSQLLAPRPFDSALDDFKGFRLFRANGANGVDIRASQDTVVGDPAVLLMNLGVDAPVLLASGTYLGDAGSLTAALHPGSLFNIFPDGFVAGSATAPAQSILPDTVAIPEPATAGLFALALASLTLRRRRPVN